MGPPGKPGRFKFTVTRAAARDGAELRTHLILVGTPFASATAHESSDAVSGGQHKSTLDPQRERGSNFLLDALGNFLKWCTAGHCFDNPQRLLIPSFFQGESVCR
jgi:hypothetical protein